MAPPPPKRLLTKDDVPGAPEWMDRLLGPLNAFLGPAGAALTHSLTFRENFAGEVRDVEVTPPDDWAPIAWENGWSTNASYVTPGWRKADDGRVHLRGVGARAAGAPSSGTVMVSGLPAPAGTETFWIYTDTGIGTADLAPSGNLIYYSGGAARWPLTDFSYDAADRTQLRWAAPVDVKLGLPQRPFQGKAGQVVVLAARQMADATLPVVVTGIDWTPLNLEKQKASPGIRIHRVWGLSPGIKYRLTLLVLPE